MAKWWRPRARRRSIPLRRTALIRCNVLRLEDRCVPATSTTLTVGPNVDVTRLLGDQSESAIAANPTNPSHVVAIANDLQNNGSSFSRSTDGGVNWSTRNITNGDGLGVAGFGDGELTYDKFGNLYVVFLDDLNNGNFACKVLTSTNDGLTFSVLASPIVGSLDQPKIATGPGTATGSQSVWVSCQGSDGAIQVAGAQVAGLGSIGTFTSPVSMAGSGGGNFGSIAVGPKGQVVVAYENPSDGSEPAAILTNLDPDGGGTQTFGQSRLATTTNVGGFHGLPAQPSRTVDAEAFLAYDRSGDAHNGRLYLVYTDSAASTPNDTNIFVRFSDNDGGSWSSPVKVNDDTGNHSQFFSGIAVDQTTGNVAVGWFDARNSPANTQTEYFVSASVDGGATFLPNVQVSKGLSDGRASTIFDPNEYGDFYRMDFVNNAIHVVWADNSAALSGNPDRPSLDIATDTIIVSKGTGGTTGGPGGPGTPGGPIAGTILVGADAGQAPVVRLVNIATGTVIFQETVFGAGFMGGVRGARGDVNGDGVPDLIVAAGAGGGPQIKIIDGKSFDTIASFFAFSPGFTGGVYIAAGDVNGDGKADIIVSAGPGGGPQVKVFSGADHSVLKNFFAYNAAFRGGITVAAGDVDGDRKIDIITGAGPGGGPQVQVFSGADGSLLRSFFAYDGSFTGGIYVAAGDLDGDGQADIVTGPGIGGGPNVRAFSGASGQMLLNFMTAAPKTSISQ
ncbi:MAG TPA: FG-GAP-like repeat-containing protein, partial [Gemmataceae bacterium]|nr:FG-GAP-like repeat-containing protein [Gemmataceae bacterium]